MLQELVTHFRDSGIESSIGKHLSEDVIFINTSIVQLYINIEGEKIFINMRHYTIKAIELADPKSLDLVVDFIRYTIDYHLRFVKINHLINPEWVTERSDVFDPTYSTDHYEFLAHGNF